MALEWRRPIVNKFAAAHEPPAPEAAIATNRPNCAVAASFGTPTGAAAP